MPEVSSQQIRKGLTTLDTVLTYGVDGLAEQLRRTAMIQALGLDPDVFFSELYVGRPTSELDLETQLEAAPTHTIVVAPIGWGKSTLLHYALRKYAHHTSTPLIVVDFKTVSQSFAKIEELGLFISHQIKRQLYVDVAKRISPKVGGTRALREAISMIAREVVHANREDLSTDAFGCVEELELLCAQSESDQEVELTTWLDHVRATRGHPLKVDVARIFTRLQRALTERDVLAAYQRIVSPDKALAKIAVAFDNADQLPDFHALELLEQWLKRSVVQSSLFQIIMCIRPENLQLLRRANNTGLFGEDAAHIRKMPVKEGTDPAVMEEWKQLVSQQYVEEGLGADDLSEIDSDELERLAFEDMIHERRLAFAEKAVKGNKVGGVVTADLAAVSSAAREIHRVQTISLDMKAMANGNQRVKWAGVSNFLEYIAIQLELQWEKIGEWPTGSASGAAVRRASALRSLYFRFLGAGPEAGGQFPVFNSSAFDPVRSVVECHWNRGQLLGSTDEVIDACRVLLVNLAVFNACGNTRFAPHEAAVAVSTIQRECAAVGMKEARVIDVIHDIVRGIEHRFAGLFSIDHYVLIRDHKRDVQPTDRIASTARLHRLLSYSCFSLSYLCERMIENKVVEVVTPAERVWELSHRGLVPAEVVSAFPYWLAKAMTVEARWVEQMQCPRDGAKNLPGGAFDKYVDSFTVRDRHGFRSMVFTQRIARACSIFIRQSAIRAIDQTKEREVFKAYETALNQIDYLDGCLDRAMHQSRLGQPWSIPRDRVIDIAQLSRKS